MKLGKKLAILTLVAATSLFAAGSADISSMVEKINNTKDLKVKSELLKKLEVKLGTLEKEDLIEAQKIVNNKLKLKK